MTTRTQLANRALFHLGEEAISNIDDPNNTKARACKEVISDVIDEVLRSHRWNCAISRVTLSMLAEAPNHGFTRAFQLPSDFLRLLEVNGEQFDGSDEFFEIEEGGRLLTDADAAEIRYIRRIDVPAFDALLKKAVALALAADLALPLTKSTDKADALEAKFQRAIRRAAQVDAIETSSRENRPLQRLLENSPLIRSRGFGRPDPLRYRLP